MVWVYACDLKRIKIGKGRKIKGERGERLGLAIRLSGKLRLAHLPLV